MFPPHFLHIMLKVISFLPPVSKGQLQSRITDVSLILEITFLGAEGGPVDKMESQYCLFFFSSTTVKTHLNMQLSGKYYTVFIISPISKGHSFLKLKSQEVQSKCIQAIVAFHKVLKNKLSQKTAF